MIGKKAEMSKKDMNFFSEFSTSGAQVASMLTLALVFIIILFVLAAGFLLLIVVRANGIQSDIEKIREEINDPKNQEMLENFDRLTLQLDDQREYLYVLTDLKNKLEANRFVDTVNMDTITSNIPEDVVLTDLNYVDGSIQIGGTCLSYDSALNFAAQLQDQDLFVYIHINEIFYNDPGQDLPHDVAISVWRYHFSFTGSLESTYLVTMTRYFDGVPQSLLSIPTVREYVTGESYAFAEIATYTVDGVDYQLNRILINGNVVTPERLEIMLQNDAVTGITMETTDIRLMYVEVDATPTEGGEAQ